MFRKSEVSQQEDFFGSFDFNFSSRKGRELNNPNSWWDLFTSMSPAKLMKHYLLVYILSQWDALMPQFVSWSP